MLVNALGVFGGWEDDVGIGFVGWDDDYVIVLVEIKKEGFDAVGERIIGSGVGF